MKEKPVIASAESAKQSRAVAKWLLTTLYCFVVPGQARSSSQ